MNQCCLQNLTELQERYQNVSARRTKTVASVKPQSDLVRRLLGMINSIRVEAQNKLQAVKGKYLVRLQYLIISTKSHIPSKYFSEYKL